MNYDFSQEDQTFIDAAAARVQTVLDGREMDDAAWRSDPGALAAVLGPLSADGLLQQRLGAAEPDGVSQAACVAAFAGLATRAPSLALAASCSARLFGCLIDTWGADGQKDVILPAVTSGAAVGAVALSETAMNVHNDPLETAGVEEGDTVVVTGEKSYVVNAGVARWIAVVGRLADQGAVFIVDADSEGLQVAPPAPIMGFQGCGVSSLKLDHCRIARDRVIGGLALDDLIARLKSWENLNLCALGLGMMQGAFETARDHAKSHRSGGKPVIAYQAVGFKLSEMLTLYQTAQWLTYRAAWAVESGQGDAGTLVRCAKVFSSEALGQVSAKGLQILSGAGVCGAGPVARAYHAAPYAQVAGVSNEIARVVLGDEAMGWKVKAPAAG